MALTLEQRKAMKASLAAGDVQAAQAIWQGMQESAVSFVGHPRMSTRRPAADGSPPRWSSDDFLRLPARVVSGMDEPLARYALPRKHTLRSGAAAHLGGGRPAAVSASIHGESGRMAIERRTAGGSSEQQAELGAVPAPLLASSLGWSVPPLSALSLGEDARLSRSLSDSWMDGARPLARPKPSPSRARPRVRGASEQAPSPSRREIATGAAVAVPAPQFSHTRVSIKPVGLPDESLPAGARSVRLQEVRAQIAADAQGGRAPRPPLDPAAERAVAEEAEEALRVLRQQQNRYVREKRYMEAEAARQRAEEVLAAEQTRRRLALAARQAAQRDGAAAAVEAERAELGRFWAFKFEHFDSQAQGLQRELAERHARESEELRRRLREHPPTRPISNPELLDLRKREERTAVAVGKEMGRPRVSRREAAELQAAAEELRARLAQVEAEEAERMREESEAAVHVATQQLANQQRAEISALTLRVRNGQTEHLKQRTLDFAQLHKRYQNVRSELGTQHRAECVSLEREEGLQAIRYRTEQERGAPGRQSVASPTAAEAGKASAAQLRGNYAVIVTSRVVVQPAAM